MKPLVIQFSGGRTSAFMAKFLFEHFPDREKHVLFQNTGKEREETLRFVNECDRRWDLRVVWLEAVVHHGERKGTTHKVVDYESVSRNGEPFEQVIQKYGLPNLSYPHCTRELKQNAANCYIKTLNLTDYEIALGIRADEQHRINRTTAQANNWTYPLTDIFPVTKRMVRLFWEKQDFDLGLEDYEGNCDLCFKKSISKLAVITRERPEAIDWWKSVGRKYASINAPLAPRKMYRGHRTAEDIEEMALEPTLFDNPEYEVESDCFCKST